MQPDNNTSAAIPAFYHLTLNTGDVAMQPRSSVQQQTIDLLLPIIRAGGGGIAAPAWHLAILPVHDESPALIPGARFFQFASEMRLSHEPAIEAIACWNAASSRAAWQNIPRMMVSSGCQAPLQPPPTPWLAVATTPFMALYPSDQHWFGDAERCIAWAMVVEEEKRGIFSFGDPENPLFRQPPKPAFPDCALEQNCQCAQRGFANVLTRCAMPSAGASAKDLSTDDDILRSVEILKDALRRAGVIS